MRYLWQHIETIVASYKGEVPLTHFLKQYCKRFPKLGSRDRRALSDMAYCWYRCSKGVEDGTFEHKMYTCLQLCSADKTINLLFGAEAQARCSFLSDPIFPCGNSLSKGIGKEEWLSSMLVQPNLFIRIRKDQPKLLSILQENGIDYTAIGKDCLSLPNGTKVETLLPADAYVVQDASSQQTAFFFKPQKGELWYDCCSGAGGKSLLLKDLEPSVELTVSDVRESILHNLKERFKLYKLSLERAVVANVADATQLLKAMGKEQFDGIICDVPCSGSGTWARTPEQLFFFDPVEHTKFPARQRNIAINASKCLKPGGRLIYITCSVFEAENEAVVHHLVAQTGLHLESQQIINGISNKADSMFCATLSRKS